MSSVFDWSTTAASNSNSDSGVNWVEGQLPGTVNGSGRAMMGRVAELVKDLGGALVAGGTANALTVTANSAFTTNVNGRFLAFRAASDNSAAATLDVNGIGAKSIRKMTASGDAALSGAEIQADGIYLVNYSEALNGAAGGWLLINPTIDLAGFVTLTGTQTLTNKTLTGPTLTGGTASSFTMTGSAFNGTVGATTPSTIAGTTGTFSGAVSGTTGTFSSTVTAGQIYTSTNTSAVYAAGSTGSGVQILLRPGGSSAATGQVVIASSGAVTINGTLTVTG